MKTLPTFVLAITLVGMLAAGTPVLAGGHGPVVHRHFSKTVDVHQHKWHCFRLILKKNRRYKVIVEHLKPEIYPAVYNPHFYDLKLRVKRYWKGHKKFDSGDIKGTSRVVSTLRGTHHGDRPYKFCFYNGVHRTKAVRLTVIALH